MTKRFQFPENLRVSLCSALFLLLPCAALPQINNLTNDQSRLTRTAGRNDIGMVTRPRQQPAQDSDTAQEQSGARQKEQPIRGVKQHEAQVAPAVPETP